MSAYIIPMILASVLIYGLIQKVDIFSEFVAGAKEGFLTSIKILPTLVALMTCVGMFKASGALDVLTYGLSPIASFCNIPKEVIPLGLLRPISGSGALCIFQDLLATHGADTVIGQIASVLMGSSETTFYTIAVYFGATKIRKTRHTVLCSLTGDIITFFASTFFVLTFFH